MYMKHFSLRMLIESKDINAMDVEVINLGLKNQEFHDIQDMIQTSVRNLPSFFFSELWFREVSTRNLLVGCLSQGTATVVDTIL